MNFNCIQFGGRLTRDVESKQINQKTVANFGMVANHFYMSGQEQRQEATFIECEVWGKNAVTIANSFSKGDHILVSGRLKLDKWEDKEGNPCSMHKIVIEKFSFMNSRRDQNFGHETNGQSQRY